MEREYSYSELMQMQDEAIENVRKMQEKARRDISGDKAEEVTHTVNKREKKKAVESEEKGQRREDKKTVSANRDAATVLPILLLLMNEGADSLLLLALLYIMS